MNQKGKRNKKKDKIIYTQKHIYIENTEIQIREREK